MKKGVWLLIIVLLLAGSFIFWKHGGLGPEPPAQITLINPLGPTVIPVAGISSQQVISEMPITIQYWKDTDEAVALLASKKADFAVLPISAAANIYARGINIKMLGVHEWKVFYLLATKDTPFEGWKSLVGKRVYTAHGRGQTADVIMRAALSKEGIEPDQDVKILYAPPQEIVALFKAGKVDFAALPEPFVTLAMSDDSGRIVLDFQKYWGESTGKPERIPVAGLFVAGDFQEKYPRETKELAQIFADSTRWSNENVDQALAVAAETLPTIPQPVMKKALSRIEFEFIDSSKSRPEVEFYLQKMKELYPQGTPKLPDKGFYSS